MEEEMWWYMLSVVMIKWEWYILFSVSMPVSLTEKKISFSICGTLKNPHTVQKEWGTQFPVWWSISILISSVFHIHAWVGWVGVIKMWTDSGFQWRPHMLTSNLTSQKNNCKPATRLWYVRCRNTLPLLDWFCFHTFLSVCSLWPHPSQGFFLS